MRRTSPPQYQVVATVRLTRPLALQWLVGSVVGFFVFAYWFGVAVATIQGRSLEPITIAQPSTAELSIWFVAALVLVAVVVASHELIHGFVMSAVGGSPRYGVGISAFLLPYAYAGTEATNYTRTQLLVALLAPFVVITAAGLGASIVVSSSALPLLLAVNAAGSIGDLWMAAVVAQYPADVRIGPLPDGTDRGFAVYAGSEDTSRHSVSEWIAPFCTGGLATLTALVLGALAVVFSSLAVGSGTVFLGDPNADWFLLRHENLPTGGATLEIGAPTIAILSFLGGVGWLVASRLRRVVD